VSSLPVRTAGLLQRIIFGTIKPESGIESWREESLIVAFDEGDQFLGEVWVNETG